MSDTESPLTHDQMVRALEDFVIENDELTQLETLVGRFNVFDALRIARAELRHSNFLAWLLDPGESHGLGQLFLRAVLMDILRDAPRELRPISPIELDGLDLGGVEVRREWRNIDLLILAESPRIAIAIENKVDSGEHSGQLSRYREVVGKDMPGHRAMFVFLTREGDDPSDEEWTPYDYGRLHTAITRCRELNTDAIGEDVGLFLDHYLRTIRSHFMEDEKIDELCETIYRKHRVALDLIFERKADNRHDLIGTVRDWIAQQYPSGFVGERSRVALTFAPAEWLEVVPPIGLRPRDQSRAWVHGRIYVPVRARRVRFQIRVGPTEDAPRRDALIAFLAEHGSAAGLRLDRKKIGERFATCLSEDLLASGEPIEANEETVESLAGELPRITKRVESITPLLRQFFLGGARTR